MSITASQPLRFDILAAWLEAQGAEELATYRPPRPCTPTVTSYLIRGRLVLVHRYMTPSPGWGIYIEPTPSGRAADQLDAAAVLLGGTRLADIRPPETTETATCP